MEKSSKQLQSSMRSHLSMHEHYDKAGVSRCIGSDPDTKICLKIIWPQGLAQHSRWQPTSLESDEIYNSIQELSPTTDSQRAAKAQALTALFEAGHIRWLAFERGSSSASIQLLLVLASWVTVLFISFGIFAPRNAITISTLFICAITVSSAFLILELHSPMSGLIRISSGPLRSALLQIGQCPTSRLYLSTISHHLVKRCLGIHRGRVAIPRAKPSSMRANQHGSASMCCPRRKQSTDFQRAGVDVSSRSIATLLPPPPLRLPSGRTKGNRAFRQLPDRFGCCSGPML